MTNKRKHEDDFFEVRCNAGGTMVSLELPNSLLNSFNNCTRTSEGMALICKIFDLYAGFSQEHKSIFQESIKYYSDLIIDIPDLRSMIYAFYKTYVM